MAIISLSFYLDKMETSKTKNKHIVCTHKKAYRLDLKPFNIPVTWFQIYVTISKAKKK